MATYLKNEITVNSDSKIEYQLSLHGSKRINVVVGKSQKAQHLGTFTFLDSEMKDTIFGNGCRFRDLESVMDYIANDTERAINNKERPLPTLMVDGKAKDIYVEFSDINYI